MALSRTTRIIGHLSKLQPTVHTCQHTALSSSAGGILQTRKNVKVLDSEMSFLDSDSNGTNRNTVIFLHGNPTAAYLWRNIIPHVTGVARCLAPDLIGMGHSGKNPAGSYRFVDHFKYLAAWIETMNLPRHVTIVCHDWGSGLGLHWCHLNENRVNAIIHMESMVDVMPNWENFPNPAGEFFKAMRSRDGENIVIKKNMFIERLLPGSIMRKLTAEEMDEYRSPYVKDEESRRPTLTWPREIPVAGDPKDVHDVVRAYSSWLRKTQIPKLYIHAEPGFFSPHIKDLALKFPNTQMVTVKGLHFVQEDSPEDIGKAIAGFLSKTVYK